jgi:hypothetical protein
VEDVLKKLNRFRVNLKIVQINQMDLNHLTYGTMFRGSIKIAYKPTKDGELL